MAPPVSVPFSLVAPLVAARSVSLSAGYALLLCRHSAAALSCLQRAVLELGQQQAPPAADGRLLPLLDRLTARLVPPPPALDGPLPLSVLDAAESLLPPCMLALRTELRRRHRLPHQDRITLSAFLKDAGLSLEDNVRSALRPLNATSQGHMVTASVTGASIAEVLLSIYIFIVRI